MKIKNILISACLCASTLHAAPYNGFYAGISGGSEARATQYNDKNTTQNNEYMKYNVNMIGSIYAGYLKTLHDTLCVGADVALTIPASNKEFKLVDQASAQTATVRYKRGLGFKFAPRIGHVINKTNLMYATLGFEGSKDSVTYKDGAGIARVNKSLNAWSFNPGFGFEHAMHHAWVMGVEYSYSIGKKITFNQINTGSGRSLDVQRRSHQIMFRVAHAF